MNSQTSRRAGTTADLCTGAHEDKWGLVYQGIPEIGQSRGQKNANTTKNKKNSKRGLIEEGEAGSIIFHGKLYITINMNNFGSN